MKNTSKHEDYWENRKIDWSQAYTSTWNHPHRAYIVQALKSFYWFSLWEFGCASGPNLIKIAKEIPNRQLGGSDISKDAIEQAKKDLLNSIFHVEPVYDVLLSDNAVDVTLSDATMIYMDHRHIKKALNEMVRTARSKIILCEWHSPSWWQRLKCWWTTGYYVHNYKKLLEDLGCWDIQIYKLPPNTFGGSDGWSKYGSIIIANK